MATKENLDNLEKFGEALLKKPVSRVKVDDGQLEPLEHGATNMEELKTYVHALLVHIYINTVTYPVHIYLQVCKTTFRRKETPTIEILGERVKLSLNSLHRYIYE